MTDRNTNKSLQEAPLTETRLSRQKFRICEIRELTHPPTSITSSPMAGMRRPLLFRMAATLLGAVAAAAVVTAAGISVSSKPFTATISPATFVPGGSGTWHYTIKDADHNGVPSSQPLGSAHISIPHGWTVTSVSAAGPPGTTWNAGVNTSTQPGADRARRQDTERPPRGRRRTGRHDPGIGRMRGGVAVPVADRREAIEPVPGHRERLLPRRVYPGPDGVRQLGPARQLQRHD